MSFLKGKTMRLSVWEKSLVFVCFLTLILQGVCGRHNTNGKKSLPAMVKYSAQISTAISCVYIVYSVTLPTEIRVRSLKHAYLPS
jgi:hypothetical protein